ncbi:hypothetical protein [Christiangramia forsetii]|uniref:Secreted protein n=2 Tax=Christiangramia forsetii TaxID=411153 RepID=A0M1L1_CHRFK|nr:hypothetical protein [Christiangramia forsetii]GGG42269.1 hypothetical protein GCM10011532_27590 [Christiangramia forsetii]CAL66506.1 secreted protein [Christiangramia forsetii KT0803]
MKKIITLILVAGWVLSSYSQRIIQLEETRLNFDPTAEIVFEDYANGIVKVKEKFSTQFRSDAISFMKKNFDILRYMEAQDNINGDIIVTAKCSNGYIKATYNQDGEIVNNYQKFKNIPLPYHVRNEVYSQNKGWTMTSNKYIAYGRSDQIEKQKYIMTLERGKEKTKMKLTPSASISGVASID